MVILLANPRLTALCFLFTSKESVQRQLAASGHKSRRPRSSQRNLPIPTEGKFGRRGPASYLDRCQEARFTRQVLQDLELLPYKLCLPTPLTPLGVWSADEQSMM